MKENCTKAKRKEKEIITAVAMIRETLQQREKKIN